MSWTSDLTPGGSFLHSKQLPNPVGSAVAAGQPLAPAFRVKGDGELEIDGQLGGTDGLLSFLVQALDADENPTGPIVEVKVGTYTDDERFKIEGFKVFGDEVQLTLVSDQAATVKRLLVLEINQ